MAKKPTGGKHVSPRKPVQLPAEWQRVAQEMAAERPMPLMWLLVELVKAEAERQGRKDLPATPWDILPGNK